MKKNALDFELPKLPISPKAGYRSGFRVSKITCVQSWKKLEEVSSDLPSTSTNELFGQGLLLSSSFLKSWKLVTSVLQSFVSQ